jgi:hypothetical protein
MAEMAAIVAVAVQNTSSYRVKFQRNEFLELAEIAKPNRIYNRGKIHFFAFDDLEMYTFECKDSDFKQKVMHAIEFSNQAWSKWLTNT